MSERDAPPIAHEAAYLRAALLLGLVHERDVSAWAQWRLAQSDASTRSAVQLTDLLLAEEALSPMREALRPLEDGVSPLQSTAALLAGLSVDDALAPRSVADLLRVLGLLRREFSLAPDIIAAIDAFIERAMLADANVGPARAPSVAELDAWMREVTPDAFFRFEFDDVDEAAAFLAAVSRKLVRNRTVVLSTAPEGGAWIAADGERAVVTLNQRSWRLAVHEFSPLPIISRVPALTPPSNALRVLDERTTAPLGTDQVAAILERVGMRPRVASERRTGDGGEPHG